MFDITFLLIWPCCLMNWWFENTNINVPYTSHKTKERTYLVWNLLERIRLCIGLRHWIRWHNWGRDHVTWAYWHWPKLWHRTQNLSLSSTEAGFEESEAKARTAVVCWRCKNLISMPMAVFELKKRETICHHSWIND